MPFYLISFSATVVHWRGAIEYYNESEIDTGRKTDFFFFVGNSKEREMQTKRFIFVSIDDFFTGQRQNIQSNEEILL